MKLDQNVLDCLDWEVRNGIRTAASVQLLKEQAEADPTLTVMTLQEQLPTSYGKQPPEDDGSFLGLDLRQYKQFKPAAKKSPVTVNTPSAKVLSEAQLEEARASLYHSAAGVAAHKALPAGIHARLFRAIAG